MTFSSILIANRGEIACRILRTANALGYRTIAVYSDADRNALHVELADDAVAIGPPPAADSYLNIERILGAARAAGAAAIHPGYGFLSENATFATACGEAGIAFIGPGAEAISLMGNKAAAKRRMLDAGVACLPGYQEADQSDAVLVAAAADIGFPVMIKAAAGGGGRGMRVVTAASEFAAALELARAEAQSAFGSGEVILERALMRPRHVEVQVLADAHGNVVHLGERDCSVQRRHQKVIEEAPCPVLSEALRERMGAAAVQAAKNIGYRGAGTVEFLLSEEGEFFFMEMNTRLQVEHPVTEMITGLDIVEQQIRVAEGQPLGISQAEVRLTGHAIEVRLYAEDPAVGFLPCAGRVEWLRLPAGEGIRVDGGVRSGDEITGFYDPLIAKIVAVGANRRQALQRLHGALVNTALFGVASNRDFLIDAVNQKTFSEGAANTAFVAQHYPEGSFNAQRPAELPAIAAVLQHSELADQAYAASVSVSPELRGWSSTGSLVSHYRFHETANVRVQVLDLDHHSVIVGDKRSEVAVQQRSGHAAAVRIDGHTHHVTYDASDPRRIHIATNRCTATLDNVLGQASAAPAGKTSGKLLAPMHGIIVALDAVEGSSVVKGQRLGVLEAMKMQHELLSDTDGIVGSVHVRQGDQVAANAPLVDITPAHGGATTNPDTGPLSQALDFLAESEALYQLLAPLDGPDFDQVTQFKDWTINDVLTHLHVWNQAADLALTDETALTGFLGKVQIALLSGDLRDFETSFANGLRGVALREQWRDFYRAMAKRFAAADPKARVKWAGPDMSVRSSITARLMETWAHGQELYDLLGVERLDEDRIRNIAILGINTFGWTFKNRRLDPPGPPPRVTLTAPSGETWEWNADSDSGRIRGSATEFCQVVTQVRNIADTHLEVTGSVAAEWMAAAQCFAGPPNAPPAPGSRFRVKP